MNMIRNISGGLLALIGAAAMLISPWMSWYAGRHGDSFKFYEVFGGGITGSRSGVMDSLFFVFLVTAALTVVGVLMRSRSLVSLGAIIAFGTVILWMIRQYQVSSELVITSKGTGLGAGFWWGLVGGLIMVIGAAGMKGRAPRPAAAPAEPAKAPEAAKAPTPATSPAERTGTERLSKQEQEMLGLTEDAQQKSEPNG